MIGWIYGMIDKAEYDLGCHNDMNGMLLQCSLNTHFQRWKPAEEIKPEQMLV